MKFILILFCFINANLFAISYRGDVFSISINNNNQLCVEGEVCPIENLGPKLYTFLKTNQIQGDEYDCARYTDYTKLKCENEISVLSKKLQAINSLDEDYLLITNRINKWKRRLFVLEVLDVKHYRFIHETHYILIKAKSKTSYQTYIDVLSQIKSTINMLRNEKAQELFGFSYKELMSDNKTKQMRKYANVIRLLVPERIVDAPVKN